MLEVARLGTGKRVTGWLREVVVEVEELGGEKVSTR